MTKKKPGAPRGRPPVPIERDPEATTRVNHEGRLPRFPDIGSRLELHFCRLGAAFFRASCHRELIKRGIAGMLIIKASVVASAADAFGELYWLPD
jgi:hypothetical protein